MRLVTAKRGASLSLVSILGIFCIALVLAAGVLHVAHVHANGQTDQDCALCVSAHQAVQVTAVVAVMVSSQPVVYRIAEHIDPAPRQRFVQQLANRPPPVPDFA
jgi:amino acid permease